jgi:hypothetical protein
VMNCSWWTHIPDFYSLGDPLLVCSLPRYMHFYRPLLSCNNAPLFWLPLLPCLQSSWEHFSCIRGYIILSVACQWVFQFGFPDNMSQYHYCYYWCCDVLPVNTSNNLWVPDFCISIYWILYQAEFTIT